MALGVQRETLAKMLRMYGEEDLAVRALSVTDDELAHIGTLGGYYAFSDDAMEFGGSMGGVRALALAAVDVLEGTGRDLRRPRTEQEVTWGLPEALDEEERRRDRELRRHAAERQIPADESQRILDILDPPAWDPPPPGATPTVRRCHELRTKPLRDFTVEDLRVMIEQQVALHQLVGIALMRLMADPLAHGGRYPGDLLASVLQVDPAYWQPRLDPEVSARILAEAVRDRADVAPELRKIADRFIRDHPHRSAAGFSG